MTGVPSLGMDVVSEMDGEMSEPAKVTPQHRLVGSPRGGGGTPTHIPSPLPDTPDSPIDRASVEHQVPPSPVANHGTPDGIAPRMNAKSSPVTFALADNPPDSPVSFALASVRAELCNAAE